MSSDDLRTSRAEVTQESVLGNPDVFELVEARGKLAACYVDAGTGQTIMYLSVLRARPEDGRAVLHHQELLKIGSILKCFEDSEKKAVSQMRFATFPHPALLFLFPPGECAR